MPPLVLQSRRRTDARSRSATLHGISGVGRDTGGVGQERGLEGEAGEKEAVNAGGARLRSGGFDNFSLL